MDLNYNNSMFSLKKYTRAQGVKRLESIAVSIDISSPPQKDLLDRFNARCEELHIHPPPEIRIIPYTMVNAGDAINRVVYFGGLQFDTLDINEQMALAGHEAGHIRLGHNNRKSNPDQEMAADQFAGIFCGSSEYLASALEKNRMGVEEWSKALDDLPGIAGWVTRMGHSLEKRKEEKTYGKFSDRVAILRNSVIDR